MNLRFRELINSNRRSIPGVQSFWPKNRTHTVELKKLGVPLHEVKVENGRRQQEDEWTLMLRDKWSRERHEDFVIYHFVNEFDAVMCKMWFG